MKHIFTFVISACHIAVFGQAIQNGTFEAGTTPNNISQIARATYWHIACNGNTDLYDCQADPVGGSGPGSGSVIVGTPAACINPRSNGSNNCRFGSIRTAGQFSSSGSLYNELDADLLPNITYTIQAYVARGLAPSGSNLNWPATRRIEAVLRATTDGNYCDNEIIVPIPIDIVYNNCNWMFVSATFQLTPTQALGGYDLIEFRDLSRVGYDQERIYIDDVELLGGTAGLSETLSSETVNIYPVPTSSNLHIDTKFSFEKVLITDLMGKVLLEGADSKTISVETLSDGVYIIQLVNGEEIYSQRIVKQ